jgi:hypothetical protein
MKYYKCHLPGFCGSISIPYFLISEINGVFSAKSALDTG